ncbi:unnamed protein product [Closterium sp. NIES-53]
MHWTTTLHQSSVSSSPPLLLSSRLLPSPPLCLLVSTLLFSPPLCPIARQSGMTTELANQLRATPSAAATSSAAAGTQRLANPFVSLATARAGKQWGTVQVEEAGEGAGVGGEEARHLAGGVVGEEEGEGGQVEGEQGQGEVGQGGWREWWGLSRRMLSQH